MFRFEERDLKNYFCQVVQLVGQRIGIEDALWRSSAEVLEIIKDKNKELLDRLEVFFKEYRAWWEFDVELESEGKMGKLTADDFEKRECLVSKRDLSRKSFIELLPQ